jgi:membrane protein implicated in regulation of membrane protease activity
MKNAKLILTVLAIVFAIIALWVTIGLIITIIQFAFVIALVVFGIAIYRKLSGKSQPQQLADTDGDRELKEALRQLEEIKRRQQLTK